jgi:hypothetical protein
MPAFLDSNLWTIIMTILSAIVAGVWGVIRWIAGKFDRHEERIVRLETNTVCHEEFSSNVRQIYDKVDAGFKHLNERLDAVYQILATSLQGKG